MKFIPDKHLELDFINYCIYKSVKKKFKKIPNQLMTLRMSYGKKNLNIFERFIEDKKQLENFINEFGYKITYNAKFNITKEISPVKRYY